MNQIIQIIAATPGWDLVTEHDDGTLTRNPIACWALVEGPETGHRVVVPVDPTGSSMWDGDDGGGEVQLNGKQDARYGFLNESMRLHR